MGMTYTEIATEVQARGFDYASDTRLSYWINRAYASINEREAWPYLEATTTGTAPLTVTDLRAVISVVDTTNANVLVPEDYRTLRENDPALSATGTPEVWYADFGDTNRSVNVYPNPSAPVSLDIRYVTRQTTLADDDEPILPDRFHYLIVDGACVYAYRDSDNAEMAQVCKDALEDGIQEMTNSLLTTNFDQPYSSIITGASTDW